MRGKASEITKLILKSILVTGAVAMASTSPVFASKALPGLAKGLTRIRNKQKAKKKLYNSFYYLKRRGLFNMEYRGRQLYISLTKEGKEKARSLKIDELKIEKAKKWDKKWRILIFDIMDKDKLKREALRGKLKELGLFQLQKSVWVCPYNFEKEMDILRNFFDLTKIEMNTIIAHEIDNDWEARKFFGI